MIQTSSEDVFCKLADATTCPRCEAGGEQK